MKFLSSNSSLTKKKLIIIALSCVFNARVIYSSQPSKVASPTKKVAVTDMTVITKLKDLHLASAMVAIKDSSTLHRAFSRAALDPDETHRLILNFDSLLSKLQHSVEAIEAEDERKTGAEFSTAAPGVLVKSPALHSAASPRIAPALSTSALTAYSTPTPRSSASTPLAARSPLSGSPVATASPPTSVKRESITGVAGVGTPRVVTNGPTKTPPKIPSPVNAVTAATAHTVPSVPAVLVAEKTAAELFEELPTKIDTLIALTADPKKTKALMEKLKHKDLSTLKIPGKLMYNPTVDVSDFNNLLTDLCAKNENSIHARGKALKAADSTRAGGCDLEFSSVAKTLTYNRVMSALTARVPLNDLKSFHALLDTFIL